MASNITRIMPTSRAQAALVARLCSMPRRRLERTIEALIAVCDLLDPDPDLEPAGDEQDGTFAEDEEAARFEHMSDGPGCAIGDPDAEHDGREIEDAL